MKEKPVESSIGWFKDGRGCAVEAGGAHAQLLAVCLLPVCLFRRRELRQRKHRADGPVAGPPGEGDTLPRDDHVSSVCKYDHISLGEALGGAGMFV